MRVLPPFSKCSGLVVGAALLCGTAFGQGEIRRLTNIPPSTATGFGNQVAGAGDVNGDGFADVAVADSQSTRIFSGLDGAILRQHPRGRLLELGDVNGDGKSDLLISQSSTVSLVAYSGATGNALWTAPGIGILLTRAGDHDLDGVPDFGSVQSNTIDVRSGASGTILKSIPTGNVQGLGGGHDIDADGTPDFIVSKTGTNPDTAEVISGATGTVLHSVLAASNGAFAPVRLLGDIDDDLRPDFVVGEPNWLSLGRVRAFSGATGALIWQTTGAAIGGSFGLQLITFPDLNGDTRPDLLVGANFDAAPGSDVSTVTALSGRTGTTLFKTFSTDVDDLYGYSMADAGDVNGDGNHDFIVGEELGSWQAFNTGIAYIYSSHCWEQYADLPGCGGTGGVKPTLAAAGCISPLCTSFIHLSGCYGSAPGFLLIRFGPGSGTTIAPGCNLYVNPASALMLPFVTAGPFVAGGGQFALPTVMPVGIPATGIFTLQALVADPGVPLGFSASNGLIIDKF